MLKFEFNSLDPRSFENIQDFFTKFKSLLIQLKGCGINKSKKEKYLILHALSKLGLEYVAFVSIFHIVRITSGAAWKIPTLDVFIKSMMHEQDKIIKMGSIKSSKVHAIFVHERIESNSKSKQKGKEKKDLDPRKGGNFKPSGESSSYKVGKGKQGKSKCGY